LKNKQNLTACHEIYIGHKNFLANIENDLRISSSSLPSMSPQLGSCALNFEAIKETLLSSKNTSEICCILEALRWRVGCSSGSLEKRENTLLLTMNDVLDSSVFKGLLEIGNLHVVEHLLALVNALAGDYEGRSYLINKGQILEKVLELMFDEEHESYIRRVSLFILQKLSLRKKVQDFLIQNQMIQFAVETLLSEIHEISEIK
jgi:hypothetical protein